METRDGPSPSHRVSGASLDLPRSDASLTGCNSNGHEALPRALPARRSLVSVVLLRVPKLKKCCAACDAFPRRWNTHACGPHSSEPVRPCVTSACKLRGQVELDDTKSKKGLGESYTEEFMNARDAVEGVEKEESELHREVRALWKALGVRLDALSHFQFAPKPVVEEMSITNRVPALQLEEVRSPSRCREWMVLGFGCGCVGCAFANQSLINEKVVPPDNFVTN